jgi:hypothetical protein
LRVDDELFSLLCLGEEIDDDIFFSSGIQTCFNFGFGIGFLSE